MTNQDNKYHIYIRSTGEKVPCSKKEFDIYYRDINTFRCKQQRHGQCVCPKEKRYSCDMNCETCPFRRAGDSLSLDFTKIDEDGNEKSWIDDLVDPSTPIDDLVIDGMQFQHLFKRLEVLMPQAIEIGLLRQQGLSDIMISSIIGIPRMTFISRLKKVKQILEKELPEFF